MVRRLSEIAERRNFPPPKLPFAETSESRNGETAEGRKLTTAETSNDRDARTVRRHPGSCRSAAISEQGSSRGWQFRSLGVWQFRNPAVSELGRFGVRQFSGGPLSLVTPYGHPIPTPVTVDGFHCIQCFPQVVAIVSVPLAKPSMEAGTRRAQYGYRRPAPRAADGGL